MLEKPLLVLKMFVTALYMVTCVLQTISGPNLKLTGKDAKRTLKKDTRNPKMGKAKRKKSKNGEKLTKK